MYGEPAGDWNPVCQHRHLDTLTTQSSLTFSFHSGYISESSYLCSIIKIRRRSNLRKEGFYLAPSLKGHFLLLQERYGYKSMRQQGTLYPSSRSQSARNVDSLVSLSFPFPSFPFLSFLFFNLDSQYKRWCHSDSGWVLAPQLNLSANSFRDTPSQ